ncbi:MAG TPA: SPOR domain-containing protein [Vicinamibacterales bacterium]
MAQNQDDAFHEIQLSGKQLVFLFMAATVVSVVIFLLGVLVGRNVRERNLIAEATATSGTEPMAAPAPAPATTPAAEPEPPKNAPTYSYPGLGDSKAPVENLKPAEKPSKAATTAKSEPKSEPKPPAIAAEKPAPAPAPPPPVEKPAPVTAAPPPSPPPASTEAAKPAERSAAPADPGGQGFAVQIAALNARSEADAIAKRLVSKGYSAYVLAPASGTPSVFRVRVGKFSTRREAETVAAKLQKEEQFKPWVTR